MSPRVTCQFSDITLSFVRVDENGQLDPNGSVVEGSGEFGGAGTLVCTPGGTISSRLGETMRSTIALCTFAVMTTVATWSPATASAQVIELTPFVGGFSPVGDFVDENGFLGKHQTGLAAGVRFAYRGAGRVGFAAGATYAASDFEVDNGFSRDVSGGHVLALSGAARYALSAPQSRIQTHITGGVAVLTRGGDAYDEFGWSGATDIGAVVGGGVSIPFGERFRLAIELEDFVSSASVEEDSQTTQARLQNDIMLSVGVAIPVWPRR